MGSLSFSQLQRGPQVVCLLARNWKDLCSQRHHHAPQASINTGRPQKNTTSVFKDVTFLCFFLPFSLLFFSFERSSKAKREQKENKKVFPSEAQKQKESKKRTKKYFRAKLKIVLSTFF
jgi:ATP-dependent Zn protease